MQINRPLTGGLAAAGALAAGSLLPGCGTTRAAAPRSAGTVARKRYGGNLRVGLTGGSPSDTLDPHQGLTYLDTARAQSLYEPLVQLSPGASAVDYVLAAEMTPRGPKGTEWVIKLKPGVTFHDGRPLTSSDVIYTFRRIIAGRYSAAHVLGPVDTAGIKALDPRTVLVPMTRPYAPCPSSSRASSPPKSSPPGSPPGPGPMAPARSSTRASLLASSRCSPATRTTASMACPTPAP